MLLTDVCYAVRSLRHSRGFSALAALVLALGIGATSAVFSLIDGTLIRPLPFADPDRLVMLWEHPPGYARNRVSPLNFQDWAEQNHTFAGLAAVAGGGRTLTNESGVAERVPGQSVTTAFFDVLGIAPMAGRTFVLQDMLPQPNVVVIGERFWRDRLSADPAAVGRMLRLDGQPFTIVGIVPATFQILYPADVWTPFPLRRTPEQRRQHYLQVMGRMRPGVTLEQARSDMALVADGIASQYPDTNKNWTVTVEPLYHALVSGEVRSTTIMLGGVVAFVLLMACANVANLLLARGIGRSKEIAIRSALGASNGQIARLLLAESAVLAIVGGLAGLAVSWVALRAAPSIVPAGLLPEGIPLRFDSRVTVFAAALTGLVGVLFGLVPAWHAIRRTSLGEPLSVGGRAAIGGAGRLRALLAASEVAGAVLLLAGAGLLVRTLASMAAQDPGFHADSVLTMSVSLPTSRYADQRQVLTFFRQADAALAAIPGVQSVGFVDNLPLDGWDIGQPFEVVGEQATDAANRRSAHYQITSPHYFDTMGIRLAAGRAFTERDVANAPQVCIVNEEFVRRFLTSRNPIGTIVKVPNMAPGQAPTIAREIVGVIKQVAIDAGEKERAVEIYVPMEQNVWYGSAIAIKTAGPPATYASAVRAAISGVDRDQPVTRIRSMDEVAAEATNRPRFRATLVSTFALLSLALAAVGIFSVLTFSVRERTREFGVRLALGATLADILRLVLADSMKIAIAGAIVGLGAATLLTRMLESLLFGITPLDPVALLGAPAILVVIALVASALPALRAIQVDPAVTLRDE
jgi:predicted permease